MSKEGHVTHGLPDEIVLAVGHTTIAASELEVILAWIGAYQAGGNSFSILAKPGEPLRASRLSVAAMTPLYRDAFLPVLDKAADVLAKRNSIVHAMWVNDHPDQVWELLNYRTRIRQPADPVALHNVAVEIMEVRNRLVCILTDQINSRPPSPPGPLGW